MENEKIVVSQAAIDEIARFLLPLIEDYYNNNQQKSGAADGQADKEHDTEDYYIPAKFIIQHKERKGGILWLI